MSKVVKYWVPVFKENCSNELDYYTQVEKPGIFASSGKTYTLTYNITDKFKLLANGQLTIRLYSSPIINLEQMAVDQANIDGSVISMTMLKINNKNIIGGISDIDSWRNAVSLNSIPSMETNATSATPVDFYVNPEQWIKIDETNIDVNNGIATFEIPASNDVSLLFVEASYLYSAGNSEVIRGDLVFMANPLNVGPILPKEVIADGVSKYEIGSKITWMDEELGEIDDGVPVTFLGVTAIKPSSSVTINGEVSGMFIGSHVSFSAKEGLSDTCSGSKPENISVKVESPTGYTYSCTRIFSWLPSEYIEIGAKGFGAKGFAMFASQNGNSAWSDGQSNDCGVEIELNDGINDQVVKTVGNTQFWVGDGIPYLLGDGQINNASRPVHANKALYPSTKYWDSNGIVRFNATTQNINIGYEQAMYPSSLTTCPNSWADNPPWSYTISITSGYKDDANVGHGGTAYLQLPFVDPDCIYYFPPKISYKEPLGMSIYIESLNGAFIRDGIDSPNIVVDITWKGQPIRKKFKFYEGTPEESEVNYPLPIVSFLAGIAGKLNSNGDSLQPKMIDTRAPLTAYLTVDSHPDINLSSYTVQSGLIRTSIVADHTHACSVDDNGNGVTDIPIVLSGVVVSHTHVINNFVTINDATGHIHNVRCVAITQIQPTTNTTVDIYINGYAPYDPTGCSPNTTNTSYFPYTSGINRIMYDTLVILGSLPTYPRLTLDLSLGYNLTLSNRESNTFLTSQTPGDTSKGFDILARAYFSSYEDSPGHTVPEREVNDGTRVSFDIKTYKPMNSPGDLNSIGTTEESIIEPVETIDYDSVRNYLTINITGFVNSEGQSTTTEISANICSTLQWMPEVREMISDPTENKNTAIAALSNVTSIGSSQIFDAVCLSANRIIDFNYNNANSNSYSKAIVLLSDGDENASDYSIEQAISIVSSIGGIKETPIVAICLGSGYSADKIIMLKFEKETGGIIKYIRDASNTTISEIISTIITDDSLGFNSGTYTVTQQASSGLPINVDLSNVVVPTGASVEYRYRTSTDGVNWSSWSNWIDYSRNTNIVENIDNLAEYYQYEVKMIGNEVFNTPYITEGVSIEYLIPKEAIVFFKPTTINVSELEYMSSVLITYAGIVPSTSVIKYGITQSNSTDVNDYLIAGSDVEANKQEILLSRYNEALLTTNYKTYIAINGRWPNNSDIEIYKCNNSNGELIDPSTYVSNYVDGTINFLTSQNKSDKFVICIDLDPVFRFICKIKNYGTSTAIIDHIGLIHNIMQRIPRDSSGNIIHKTINSRLL